MTCKECFHYDICATFNTNIPELYEGIERGCEGFQNKADIVDLKSQVFTHICKSDKLLYPDEFSIFARVVSEDDKTITIDRFQKFGAIYCGRLTFEKKDFEKYYKEVDNDI